MSAYLSVEPPELPLALLGKSPNGIFFKDKTFALLCLIPDFDMSLLDKNIFIFDFNFVLARFTNKLNQACAYYYLEVKQFRVIQEYDIHIIS